MLNRLFVILLVGFSALVFAEPAFAYIGPGAGFAFLGSAFVFILTFLMAAATILFWPLQWLVRSLAGKKISKNARTRRVVIVGLDGLEPKLVDRFMEAGRLPHLKALSEEGGYSRLGTTLPPLSPVAWSTFQTGVNPGAHNIFDFLTRDKRYCMPDLASTKTESPSKFINFGKYRFPLGKGKVTLLRKSRPFWKLLGKRGIFCNILRVPISYPPEPFEGNILSAMCTPDLKGTQGSFCVFTTKESAGGKYATGGEFRHVKKQGQRISSWIEGPANPFLTKPTAIKVRFSVVLQPETDSAVLEVGKEKVLLEKNKFSKWVRLEFRLGFGKKIYGMCRFCLREAAPDFFLYVSPINIDPERPALPIAHPIFFASMIAKKQGSYGTLGLMEDTFARNEHALDDQLFLQQTYLTHQEREAMFFDALEQTRQGVVACVFDASDRIQHMFWRYLDEKHPSSKEDREESRRAIPDMYERMDDLVGRVRAQLLPGDVLIVLSDHGFTSFRRCLNLNTWLYREGYLALKEDAKLDSDYLQYVDWSKTRAFSLGLAGIYLNRVGRERYGIVEPEQTEQLKAEIIKKLQELKDPNTGKRAVHRVYDAAQEYRGLYRDEAADLIVGSELGYRVSWESVTGGMRPEIFEDNLKAWSGDHDVDPELVPGVLFSNIKIKGDEPHIADIAPTVLDLFAVKKPAYMEGKVIL